MLRLGVPAAVSSLWGRRETSGQCSRRRLKCAGFLRGGGGGGGGMEAGVTTEDGPQGPCSILLYFALTANIAYLI